MNMHLHYQSIDFGRFDMSSDTAHLFSQRAEVIPFFTKLENGYSCLSQWHRSSFTVEGVSYGTAEQFMMHAKARLFGDDEMARRILDADAAHDQKRLGQNVRGFKTELWERERCAIAFAGNLAKFSQSAGLRKRLLRSKGAILAEASPKDFIWGVGLAHDNPDLQNPRLWQGMNLLGYVLMSVRTALCEAVAD